VILYVRVSTDEQPDRRSSLDGQIEILRAIAKRHKWIVVDEIIDHGYSGASPDRPGLFRVLDAVKNGRVDLVAADAFDWWARKLAIFLDIVDTANQHNVQFYSRREGWDTSTPAGKFGIQLMGAVAELQREIVADDYRGFRFG